MGFNSAFKGLKDFVTYIVNVYAQSQHVNSFVTSGTYMSHKESFQDHWDNCISLFLHAAIYLEVSLFRRTSRNAFSRETVMHKCYCVQR